MQELAFLKILMKVLQLWENKPILSTVKLPTIQFCSTPHFVLTSSFYRYGFLGSWQQPHFKLWAQLDHKLYQGFKRNTSYP